jgi:chromosome segregation ATPase
VTGFVQHSRFVLASRFQESELNSTLSAQLETTNSELQAALSRETDLKASLEETASGVEGAELRLEQMQRRHEGEIRAVRGIAQAQAKGLEERLKGAQEKAEEVRALKDAETAAR